MFQFSTKEELRGFIKNEIMTTSQVLEYLGITRQTLGSLVKRGKLQSVYEEKAVRLFLRSDVEERKKEAEERKKKFRPFDY